MSTVDEASGGEVGELALPDRIRHLAEAANPVFAAVCVALPLVLTAAGYALAMPRVTFYVHVATGALWFALAIFMAVVLGPVLGSLDEAAAAKVDAALTPKMVWFIFGASLGTVVSGTALLDQLYAFDQFWGQVALGYGWLLFGFGLLVTHRMHLKTYYLGLAGNPKPDRMERLQKRVAMVGLAEAVLMLGIIYVMLRIRLG